MPDLRAHLMSLMIAALLLWRQRSACCMENGRELVSSRPAPIPTSSSPAGCSDAASLPRHGISPSARLPSECSVSKSEAYARHPTSSSAATTLPPALLTLLLSIPSALLITPEKVRVSASVRRLLSARLAGSLLSPEQLLILFLVLQRRQGAQSSFSALPVSLLPVSYSSLEWWTEAEISSLLLTDWDEQPLQTYHDRCECSAARLDGSSTRCCQSQHPALRCCRYDADTEELSSGSTFVPTSSEHETASPACHLRLTPSAPPMLSYGASRRLPFRCLVSLAEYQWAFSTVATRSCHWPDSCASLRSLLLAALTCLWPGSERRCVLLSRAIPGHAEPLVLALLYLPALSTASRQYELHCRERQPETVGRCCCECEAGEEVRICYGELSNWQLLTRYGFVLDETAETSRSL